MSLCKYCATGKHCMANKNKTECKLYKPMTEQEYIQTCNTEQLAEVLARYVCGWTTNHSSYEMALHSFSEWLKQPHKE